MQRKSKRVFMFGLTFNQFVIATVIACAGLLLLWLTVKAATFTYTKTIQNSAGLPADGAIVKVYRGINGSLYARDTCNTAGMFSFTLSDSFSFYTMEMTNWDVNAPWRPKTWTAETRTELGLAHAERLEVGTLFNPHTNSLGYTQADPTNLVGIIIEDTSPTWAIEIAESLRAHNFGATFAVNCAFGSNTYSTGFTAADSTIICKLVEMGMTIGDHSPSHAWVRGLSLATYRAMADSTQAMLTRWTGKPCRIFVRPMTVPYAGVVFGDTMMTILPEFYDYAYLGQSVDLSALSFSALHWMPVNPIKFSWARSPFTESEAYHQAYTYLACDPYNFLAFDGGGLGACQNDIISIRAQGATGILRYHPGSATEKANLLLLINQVSKGVATLVPAEVLLDQIYRVKHEWTGERMFDPYFIQAEAAAGYPDQATLGFFRGWYGPSDSIPTHAGHAVENWLATAPGIFSTTKFHPGRSYEFSIWYKHKSAYTGTATLNLWFMDWRHQEHLRPFNVSHASSDSLWYFAAKDTIIPDTIIAIGIKWVPKSGTPQHKYLLAYPSIVESGAALRPVLSYVDIRKLSVGSQWLSADRDSMYLKLPNEQVAAYPLTER